MMKEEIFLLLSADSTHLIIKSEKLLKEHGIECRIIPLPSEIKATCGLSIKTEVGNREKVEEIIKANDIKLDEYNVRKTGLKKHIEKLS